MFDEGGTAKMVDIEGYVIGSRPGQKIVLYARSGDWYVQPFVDQPLTRIQPDSTWKSSTHMGTEYAAMLVEPDYSPPARTAVLPTVGGPVATAAVVKGEARFLIPKFWQAWWFRPVAGLACILALVALHRMQLRQLSERLNSRFNERLDERIRIAQDLHDSLLQHFVSASMKLHVALEQLPEDSEARQPLNQVKQLMVKAIDEGQRTVRGLRSITADTLDLEHAFSHVPAELAIEEGIGFRVIVDGQPRTLHPLIRDEVYRVGRDALAMAFYHARTRNVELRLEYAAKQLRIVVRDDGSDIDSQGRGPDHDGFWQFSAMRERAEKIGARLKIGKNGATGCVVEISVPSKVAFLNQASQSPLRWLAELSNRWR
jgi:signal transduction histidine kinase